MSGHAGLEHGSLNLVVFDDELMLRELLPKVKLSVDDEGFITDEDGHRKQCPCCNTDIQIDNVGHILPGSTNVYCNETLCIMDYIESYG